MEGYCEKCKAKREISGAKEVAMKGKGGVARRAMTGTSGWKEISVRMSASDGVLMVTRGEHASGRCL